MDSPQTVLSILCFFLETKDAFGYNNANCPQGHRIATELTLDFPLKDIFCLAYPSHEGCRWFVKVMRLVGL